MAQTAQVLEEDETENDEQLDTGAEDDDFLNGKIYCANCMQCKLVPVKSEKDDQYFLRIRCAAGKWKKKLGEEKIYKYCTITRRFLDDCDAYEDMGNPRDFIRDLRKTLSGKDEVFTVGA